MTRRKLAIAGVGLVLAVGGAGAAAAVAGGGSDAEEQVSGTAADRASQAALEHVGGKGEAISVEHDEEAAWEVEIKRDDGSTVDVTLDGSYKVVAGEDDAEDADENDGEAGEGDDSQ